METMVNVGVNKETVTEARHAIMDILESSVENETMQLALETLSEICGVNNTNITNCTFNNTASVPVSPEASITLDVPSE